MLRKVLEKTCLDGPILRELCCFGQYQKAFLLFWLFIRQKKGEHVQDSLENETVEINEKIKKSKKSFMNKKYSYGSLQMLYM